MIKCFVIRDFAHASEIDEPKNLNVFEAMMTAELNQIAAFLQGKQCRRPRLYTCRYQVGELQNSRNGDRKSSHINCTSVPVSRSVKLRWGQTDRMFAMCFHMCS
jgi:hypothetical protein